MARKILVVELFVVILLLAGYFFFSRNTQVNNLAIRKISLNSCYQFNLIIGHIASAGYDCIYFSTDTIPRKNDLIYQVKGRILNAEWEGCDSLLINSDGHFRELKKEKYQEGGKEKYSRIRIKLNHVQW